MVKWDDTTPVEYPIQGPYLDKSVPDEQVPPGFLVNLAGADPSLVGGISKFYGMRKVVDLDTVTGMGGIDTYSGPSFIQAVAFQKRNTSYIYRGFVVRWDAIGSLTDQQVDLVYTTDNGSTWTRQAIWATGNSITSTMQMNCVTTRNYLMVAIDGKATKTIYYSGSALTTVSSGAGSFAVELGAMTKNTTATDTSYYLSGDGRYTVAYRFYDSTRGIYSGLSGPVTIYLDHMKTSKAVQTIAFNSGGGDSGCLVDGDKVTINGRVYEADNNSVHTGNVIIDITGLTTMYESIQALADAINGDTSAVVTATVQATSVLLESKVRGSAGNAYTLTKTEVAPNQTDMTVGGATLNGGGTTLTEAESQCKAVLNLPANTAVVSGKVYADFAALFDTLQVFRSVDLNSSGASTGAILYLEQEITKSGSWATSGAWDALTVTIGTIPDESMPFQPMYDPEKDYVLALPDSGTIGVYQDQTFMTEALTYEGGLDLLFSSTQHTSPEYFTTFNRRKGSPAYGRTLAFVEAGDSLFALQQNGIVHLYKSAKLRPLQVVNMHKGRGLVGYRAGHTVGNSVLFISPAGLMLLNGMDGSMGQLTKAQRLLVQTWKASLSVIQSGYDARLDTSFFLNVARKEALMVGHATQSVGTLIGANFVGCTSGPEISTGGPERAHFITATGLIVTPDWDHSGSGTMWDLSASYTLNGTVTTGGTSVTDSGATLHADMVGSMLYFASGTNAGEGQVIATVNTSTKTLTVASAFTNTIAPGDRYAISPVPFQVTFPSLFDKDGDTPFRRWTIKGLALAFGDLSGFTSNVNNTVRMGAWRDAGTTLETSQAQVVITGVHAKDVGAFNTDGIHVRPYAEVISSGVYFDLTEAEAYATTTESRRIN
jgi:hypothetical protein